MILLDQKKLCWLSPWYIIQHNAFPISKHDASGGRGLKNADFAMSAENLHQSTPRTVTRIYYPHNATIWKVIFSCSNISFKFFGIWWTGTWDLWHARICVSLYWHLNIFVSMWWPSVGRCSAVEISVIPLCFYIIPTIFGNHEQVIRLESKRKNEQFESARFSQNLIQLGALGCLMQPVL